MRTLGGLALFFVGVTIGLTVTNPPTQREAERHAEDAARDSVRWRREYLNAAAALDRLRRERVAEAGGLLPPQHLPE
jgi:hypothetical protein